MTTQEAIDMLRRLQNPEPWEPAITNDAFDALEMAIKALEEKTSDNKNEIYRVTYVQYDGMTTMTFGDSVFKSKDMAEACFAELKLDVDDDAAWMRESYPDEIEVVDEPDFYRVSAKYSYFTYTVKITKENMQ